MNLFLAHAFTLLFLIVPAAWIAAKLAFPKLSWPIIWFSTAASSWIVGQLVFWAHPPDNGLAAGLMAVLGWIYMLPVLAIFSLFYFALRRWSGTVGTRLVLAVLLALTVAIPFSASRRWISEAEAIARVRAELEKDSYTTITIEQAVQTSNGWTVYATLDGKPHYPVYLSRSGQCTGRGG